MSVGTFTREREITEMLRFAQQKHALGNLAYAERIYKLILIDMPANREALLWYARLMCQRQQHSEALALIEKLIKFFGNDAEALYLKALVFKELGDTQLSKIEILKALALRPDFIEGHHLLSEIEMTGPKYRDFLQKMHVKLKPSTYVEIGIENGTTLKLSEMSERSIGVDPFPKLENDLPRNFSIYDMESDEFFNIKGPDLFSEDKIDLAFIDGLHESHQALRDFINVEKNSKKDSIILMHDTIPLNAETSTPERNTFFWSGDVWRTLIALSKYFTDLEFITINCPPTGITIIKNINPQRNVSGEDLHEIYNFMDSLKFADIKDVKNRVLRVRDYSAEQITEFLR